MQEFRKCDSGLVVPVEKQEPCKPKYGPLELQDDVARANAAKILGELWEAAELHVNRPFCSSHEAVREARYKAYRMLGDILLGNECPDGWELT